MCLLCYAGFLRFAELANLRRHHVFIYDNHVKLFLESSKTDVYREGRDVLILNNLSSTFAAAAAVAPPDLRICSPKYFLLRPKVSKADNRIFLAVWDVLISKTNTPTCPVNMLLRYFYLAEIPADSTDYIL
jgi:hypothetical protein